MKTVSIEERVRLQELAFDAARNAVDQIARRVPLLDFCDEGELDDLEADIGDMIVGMLPPAES